MIPFLELTQLGKTYDTEQGRSVIVKDFNLRVSEGEFVCIIGHSGCGKSTVLSITMGLNEASEGGVIVAGKEVVGPGLDRGVVFQSPALLPFDARDPSSIFERMSNFAFSLKRACTNGAVPTKTA